MESQNITNIYISRIIKSQQKGIWYLFCWLNSKIGGWKMNYICLKTKQQFKWKHAYMNIHCNTSYHIYLVCVINRDIKCLCNLSILEWMMWSTCKSSISFLSPCCASSINIAVSDLMFFGRHQLSTAHIFWKRRIHENRS